MPHTEQNGRRDARHPRIIDYYQRSKLPSCYPHWGKLIEKKIEGALFGLPKSSLDQILLSSVLKSTKVFVKSIIPIATSILFTLSSFLVSRRDIFCNIQQPISKLLFAFFLFVHGAKIDKFPITCKSFGNNLLNKSLTRGLSPCEL